MINDELKNAEEFFEKETEGADLSNLPYLDAYNDRKRRILWLCGEIDEDALLVSEKIMRYNFEDAGKPVEERVPIKLFVDTPGGSITVMSQIIGVIKASKTPVWTINWCECLSAGAHILASGKKRFGMPGSVVLVHSGSCGYSGTSEQVDSSKKFYDAYAKKIDMELLDMTKIDLKTYKKKAPSDWHFNTDDAIEYGIIDEVVDDLEKFC